MVSKDLFRIALNINEPWQIKDIKLTCPIDKEPGEINIYIEYEGEEVFHDNSGNIYHFHETEKKTWAYSRFLGYNCNIHAQVPVIKSQNSSKKLIEEPWKPGRGGYPLLVEAIALLMYEKEIPLNAVASNIGVNNTIAGSVINFWGFKSFNSTKAADKPAQKANNPKKVHFFRKFINELDETLEANSCTLKSA